MRGTFSVFQSFGTPGGVKSAAPILELVSMRGMSHLVIMVSDSNSNCRGNSVDFQSAKRLR